KNYGAPLPVLTLHYTGLVNGDVAPATPATAFTSASASSAVGTYTISPVGASDPNYNITPVNGTLTVNTVVLTVTADDKVKSFNAPNPPLTITYSGFVNGDDVNSFTTAPV